LQTIGGMILGQHLQNHAALILERRSMSRDHHPVRELVIARCKRMWLSLDFDQAHATTADRFHAFIVTEGRNIEINSAARIQNRNARLKLNDSSVNDSFRQFRPFSVLLN
jgi:hypothetical protein